MRSRLMSMGRVLATAILVMLAIFGARWLWIYYNVDPWTRDGKIRADVVQVSPDVNGLVTEVLVKNDEVVRTGQVLFVIDRPRYELAERQATAALQAAQASLAQARRENLRNRALSTLVTTEQLEEGDAKVLQLAAQVANVIAQRGVARLNLERTTVRATVNGVVTNVELRPGDYAAAGHQVLALLDTDSIHVDGYFEETKLPQIQVGDRAVVHIMGLRTALRGTVESIAAGIEDRERSASSTSLANVNPTFSWVRLAQRVPVRVKLDPAPGTVRLISGRTATVSILAHAGRAPEGER